MAQHDASDQAFLQTATWRSEWRWLGDLSNWLMQKGNVGLYVVYITFPNIALARTL